MFDNPGKSDAELSMMDGDIDIFRGMDMIV
jgi:hypothetical protein